MHISKLPWILVKELYVFNNSPHTCISKHDSRPLNARPTLVVVAEVVGPDCRREVCLRVGL